MKSFLRVCSLVLAMLLAVPTVTVRASDGFFTVGQRDGRWWFFDPAGEIFFSSGVCVTTPSGYYAPDLGYSPYRQNILDLYGSYAAWADVTYERLTSWNFNTLGAWSDTGLLGDRMPYTLVLYLSGANWETGTIPDYFSDTFYDHVAEKVAQQVVPRADDPNLIGYFFDNELRWGPDWREIRDLFGEYFGLGADDPGKIVLVEFLEDRYDGDTAAFNTAWAMSIEAFEDLLVMTQVSALPSTPAQKVDRAAFTGFVAAHFFSTCHDAIRAADPNHLILGTRFVSWAIPIEVVAAIVPHTDVVSINHYMPRPFFQFLARLLGQTLGWVDPSGMLAEFHELTGKPLLISECSIRAQDAGLPNTVPPSWFFITKQTQQARADFFEDYARQTFAGGYIIGYHWFSYMDEPPEGRFDGENSNFGLVDNNDVPWETLTERMTNLNAEATVWPIPGTEQTNRPLFGDFNVDKQRGRIGAN